LVTLRTEEYAYEVTIGTLTKPIPAKNEDGTVKPLTPAQETQKKNYDSGNKKAQAMIVQCVEPAVLQEVYRDVDIAETSAFYIWNEIKQYCVTNGGASMRVAYDDFTNFTYNTNISVEKNMQRFNTIIDTIKLGGTTLPAELINSTLLKGLPRDWEAFRQGVAATGFTYGYSAMIDTVTTEALRRYGSNGKPDDTTALFSRLSINSKRNGQKKKFQNHGKQKSNQTPWSQRGKWIVRCYRCGKQGHMADSCRDVRQGNSQDKEANNAELLEAYMATENDSEDHMWIMDSGCTNHVSNNLKLFTEYEPFQVSDRRKIQIGGNQFLCAHGIGTVELRCTNYYAAKYGSYVDAGDENHCVNTAENGRCILQKVLYTPKMRRNLISMTQLMDDGWDVKSSLPAITMEKDSRLFYANRRRKLFCLQTIIDNDEAEAQIVEEPSLLQDFHETFGHLGKSTVTKLLKQLNIEFSVDEEKDCEACIRGKQTRASYRSRPAAILPREIGHATTDLCTPNEPSIGGSHHLMCINDEYSKFRRGYFLKKKSDAASGI